MPSGQGYGAKKTDRKPRRSAVSSQRNQQRQGGRKFKGSDSLHKSSKEVLEDIKELRARNGNSVFVNRDGKVTRIKMSKEKGKKA